MLDLGADALGDSGAHALRDSGAHALRDIGLGAPSAGTSAEGVAGGGMGLPE
jgi:hypothetical protein